MADNHNTKLYRGNVTPDKGNWNINKKFAYVKLCFYNTVMSVVNSITGTTMLLTYQHKQTEICVIQHESVLLYIQFYYRYTISNRKINKPVIANTIILSIRKFVPFLAILLF